MVIVVLVILDWIRRILKLVFEEDIIGWKIDLFCKVLLWINWSSVNEVVFFKRNIDYLGENNVDGDYV